MAKRNPPSKKIRFNVFKRDDFTCQYCGSTPPNVVLEVDHIIPVKEGGENDDDNLATSCFDCNRGKAANSLSVIPETLRSKALRIKESEKQLFEYTKILQERKDRIEDDAWVIAEIFEPDCPQDGLSQSKLISIKKFIIRLGLSRTEEAAEIAICKKISSHQAFKYFCGICWNFIKGRSCY